MSVECETGCNEFIGGCPPIVLSMHWAPICGQLCWNFRDATLGKCVPFIVLCARDDIFVFGQFYLGIKYVGTLKTNRSHLLDLCALYVLFYYGFVEPYAFSQINNHNNMENDTMRYKYASSE